MILDKKAMLLYAVTDRMWTGKQTLSEQVFDAIEGGVTCVQLREKDLCMEEFAKEAEEIITLCREKNIPFIINDNVELAISCNADGIHVGQSDMASDEVRQKIGDKMILGVSVQTVEDAILAEKNGADYLGVGAVFATSTKLDADTISHELLSEICSAVKIPVVAIGGIYKHNILELKNSGICGVALVSAIFGAENIKNECKELLALSQEVVG